MWNDFKAFVLRGNVLDLAVAVVIGAAFGAIVKSLADDIILPPISVLLGKADFSNRFVVLRDGPKAAPPYTTLAEAKAAGATTLNYGQFVTNVIAFLIVAFAIFIIVRLANKLYSRPAPPTPDTKACPQCTLTIPLAATRCPNCTSTI